MATTQTVAFLRAWTDHLKQKRDSLNRRIKWLEREADKQEQEVENR